MGSKHHGLTSFNPFFFFLVCNARSPDVCHTFSYESAEWETALPLAVLDQDLRIETSHAERPASLPRAAVCLVTELSAG